MILSELGADVIKVEPVTGDGMRMAGKPFFGCQRGAGAGHHRRPLRLLRQR
jgi:crotonobetainyl-CoA:carnitine CoA-transferase CaiB-like acyl-CoA transferase